MDNNQRLNHWLSYFSASSKLHSSIQTLQYMLQRNSYNSQQQEALELALDTFTLISKAKNDTTN